MHGATSEHWHTSSSTALREAKQLYFSPAFLSEVTTSTNVCAASPPRPSTAILQEWCVLLGDKVHREAAPSGHQPWLQCSQPLLQQPSTVTEKLFSALHGFTET